MTIEIIRWRRKIRQQIIQIKESLRKNIRPNRKCSFKRMEDIIQWRTTELIPNANIIRVIGKKRLMWVDSWRVIEKWPYRIETFIKTQEWDEEILLSRRFKAAVPETQQSKAAENSVGRTSLRLAIWLQGPKPSR